MKTQLLILAVALAALGGCSPAVQTESTYLAEAKKIVHEVTPAEADAELRANKDLLLLDVSTWNEYERGHIAGAVIIPRGLLEFKIVKNDLFPTVNRGRSPRKNQPILLYCKSGGRSVLAARTLMEMGYSNVRSLKGGLDAWKEAKLPVEAVAVRPASPASQPEAATAPAK